MVVRQQSLERFCKNGDRTISPRRPRAPMRSLKPPATLAVWHGGYDKRGRWQPAQAVRAANSLAEQKKRAAHQKRQEAWAERKRRAAAASEQAPKRARLTAAARVRQYIIRINT